MKMPPLTNQQAVRLLTIAEEWDACFPATMLAWMEKLGLLRKPTAGEIEEHYWKKSLELAAAQKGILKALMREDWHNVADLARRILRLTELLNARRQDEGALAMLSPLGLAAAERLRPKDARKKA